MNFYTQEFGKAFIFKKIRPGIRSFFMKAGYEDVPYDLFGWLFYITLFMTYFIYIIFIYPFVSSYQPGILTIAIVVSWIAVQLALITLIVVYLYLSLVIKIYKRTKEIEKILPDYLQVVSSNLKGGLSFEKSLWNAMRPEFGVIAKEVAMVAKKVMTGNDLADALEEFTSKYDSPLLRRSFDLIIGEIESGGQIALIVDKVIDNIRKTKALKEEMSASTLSYMIFIGAIVIVIAPGLFALSYHLLKVMAGFSAKLTEVTLPGIPVSIGMHGIDVGDFKLFSVLALICISFFSAMLISIIEKGDIKGGVKYIPAFIISSMFFYFLFITILSSIFANIQIG
jgi:pilus assembly protein TadC